MSRRLPLPPTFRLAHERVILDNWKEDDGVYVTLRAASVPPRASAPGAGVAEGDSPEAPAFPPPPTLR